jgi:hypothetical protein
MVPVMFKTKSFEGAGVGGAKVVGRAGGAAVVGAVDPPGEFVVAGGVVVDCPETKHKQKSKRKLYRTGDSFSILELLKKIR